MKPYYEEAGITIFHGDCREILPKLAGAFTACLCDPPYHLTTGKRGGSGPASQNLNHPGGRARITTGFMGKAWDGGDVAFRPETWAEVLHVLEPGAPLMAFGGARTFHRLACAIEDGGFALSDTLCWLYGQGFPKGNSQLKPAWEPITLAWKKGKRVLAIDAGRIGDFQNSTPDGFDRYNKNLKDAGYRPNDYQRNCSGDRGHASNRKRQSGFNITAGHASAIGRWPANVLLDEESAAALDEQSGILTSGANPIRRHSPKTRNAYGTFEGQSECIAHRGLDTGGASRFFYCAKASRSERGDGNTHPTVKPIKLLEYLLRLTTGDLLDPFMGSGTTLLAARNLGRRATGIEIEEKSCEIAANRMRRDQGVLAL